VLNAPHTPANLGDGPPLVLAVIDTEEEFDWHAPFNRASTATTNIAAQPLGQAILAAAGLQPTYVIDHPVATAPAAVETLRGFVREGRATIGAHLHPWVNPPDTEQVNAANSYAGNLPAALEHDKLARLTGAITAAFGTAPTIFKAGRYGIGPNTGAALRALGYRIDLSTVPHADFSADGGPDHRGLPDVPYWSGAPGELFCIPMTRGYSGLLPSDRLYRMAQSRFGLALRLPGVFARAGLVERATLTPEGVDLAAHKRLVRALIDRGHRVFTLSYHSPSLAPGHTPYVRTPAEREAFLETLRQVTGFLFGEIGAQPTTPEALRALALARR
jgi:hypothetical protein